MIAFSKNTVKKIVFCIVITCLVMVSVLNIRPGHIWGGDFQLYIRQALSIINNDKDKVAEDVYFMLENSDDHTFSPVSYPWGFPVLLVPVVAATGMEYYPSISDYQVLKWYMTFLYIAFVIFFYLWIRNKFSSYTPVLLMVILGFQPAFISHINFIMSEIPYLCFLMLSFVFIDYSLNILNNAKEPNSNKRPYGKHNNRHGITGTCYIVALAVGIIMYYTSQIRTEGFLLFPALMAAQAVSLYRQYNEYSKKKEREEYQKSEQLGKIGILKQLNIFYVLTLYLGAAVFAVMWVLMFPSGFISHFGHGSLINYGTIVNNVVSYFYQLQHYMPFPGEVLSGLFIIICLVGYTKNLFRYTAPAVFLTLTILLFIVWPHNSTRYSLCLVPLLLFFFALGLKWLSELLKKQLIFRIVLVCFALVFLVRAGLMTNSNFPNRKTLLLGPTEKESTEMFDFVRKNTSSGDVIGFFRPRVMYLYTGRRALTLSGNHEEICTKTDWYICTIDQGDFYQCSISVMEYLAKRKIIKEVFRNSNFVIYSTKP